MASFFEFADGQFPDALLTSRDGDASLAPPQIHSAEELAMLVQAEIIPRMVASSPLPAMVIDIASQNPVITPADLEAFVPLALSHEADALMAHVDRFLARGMPVETVLVDLLAPAARELGLLWEDDRCDFLEVTMGVWRLQEIVHEIAGRRVTSLRAGRTPRRILLANMSGDQHGFALVLLEHLFELAGWETDRLSPDDGQDMTRCVAQDWYDVIGLTVSCDCHMGPLPSVIHALRSVSKNPRLRVMVGGGAFARSAVVAADVGADGFAADVRQAVTVAATLVEAAETRN